MKREIVLLHGRVQAVGYRERVMEIVRGYAVAGSVRNLRSGALEIDAEGDDDAVDGFIAAVIDERPSFARIDHVERRPATPTGLTDFRRAPSG
jgi:acylphosphatase